MLVVYKYKLKVGRNEVKMPHISKILSVAFQGDDLCMWAEVDTDEIEGVCKIHVFMTGEPILYNEDYTYNYIGTAINSQETFVVHVYTLPHKD